MFHHRLTILCLVDCSFLITWKSPFFIEGVSGVLFHFYLIFDKDIVDPDQTPHSLILYCLPIF